MVTEATRKIVGISKLEALTDSRANEQIRLDDITDAEVVLSYGRSTSATKLRERKSYGRKR